MSLPVALRIIREVRGMKQGEAAKAAGFSAPHLCQVEGDHTTISVRNMRALCGVYRVSTAEVRRIADDPCKALGIEP